VQLAVGDAASIDADFCVDVTLGNTGSGVQSVQATLADVPDEFELVDAACTARTAGFSCTASETGDGRITLSVEGQGAQCIDAGTGAIASVCLHDTTPVCPVPSLVQLDVADVTIADCASQPLQACTQSGSIACALLGDCVADGTINLFDVLHKIDIILQRVSPTAIEVIVCDDTCEGDINIFDLLQEIDAILGRIQQPLTCMATLSMAPVVEASGPTTLSTAPAELASGPTTFTHSTPRVSLQQGGRAVVLANRRTPVRGIQLTLTPEGGPVEVLGVRGTRRSRGFVVAYHQEDPTAPLNVVVVSLTGEALDPGQGAIALLRTRSGRSRGHLRITDVIVAQ
jgi:hypothetical protein